MVIIDFVYKRNLLDSGVLPVSTRRKVLDIRVQNYKTKTKEITFDVVQHFLGLYKPFRSTDSN